MMARSATRPRRQRLDPLAFRAAVDAVRADRLQELSAQRAEWERAERARLAAPAADLARAGLSHP